MTTRSTGARVAFGSCQQRLVFPAHFAPDRTGNEYNVPCVSMTTGPGCYDIHVGSLVYELKHKPESKRGFVLAARTAQRFLPPVKMTTPSPQKYQEDRCRLTVCCPGKAPFNTSTPRFKDKPSKLDSSPGPGAYAHNTVQSRKVSWPMKFSSPDWSRVPALERKALRTELLTDRDFRKQRNRVEYLRLYY